MSRGLKGDIKNLLSERGSLRGKPSLREAIRIVLTKAGVHALLFYRFYHFLHKKGLPLIPEILSRLNITLTGAEIDPGAEIGEGCRIFHSTGVVIGRGVKIGENVSILHDVTLGGSGKSLFRPGAPNGYPTIGDNVWLFGGAKVLGPITIGEGSIIGTNCVVMESIPPNTKITLGKKRKKLEEEIKHLRQEIKELKTKLAEAKDENETVE